MSNSAKNIVVAVLYAEEDQQYWNEIERHLNLLAKSHGDVDIWTLKKINSFSIT